jgi:hypothetical protein
MLLDAVGASQMKWFHLRRGSGGSFPLKAETCTYSDRLHPLIVQEVDQLGCITGQSKIIKMAMPQIILKI